MQVNIITAMYLNIRFRFHFVLALLPNCYTDVESGNRKMANESASWKLYPKGAFLEISRFAIVWRMLGR